MKISGHYNSLRHIGGKQGFPATPPVWATNIPVSFTTTVFDSWSYTTTVSYFSNAPLVNVQVKPGYGTLPSWVTLTFTGNDTSGGVVTLSGTPNDLNTLGTFNFTLTAVNKNGITDHSFTIIVIDGALPQWNTTVLSSTSITVFDTFSGAVSLTLPVKGPLLSTTCLSPNWANATFTGNVITVSGVPNNLTYIGATTVNLNAINEYGTTSGAFGITVNNGALPQWNTTVLSSTSITVFDTFSGAVSLTLPVKGPLLSTTCLSPNWANATFTGNVITISGTPNDLTYIGATTINLNAVNKYGTTSGAFGIAVNNGSIPVWNTNSLPSGTTTATYSTTANITVPGNGPLTSVTTTVGSLPAWASLSYNPTSGLITISGTPNSVAVSSFTLRAANKYGTADQAFSITIVSGVVVDPTTALLCHFDAAVQDDSHNGVTITNMGNAKFGNSSAYFNGSSSYIAGLSNNSILHFGTGDFTFEAWVYNQNTPQVQNSYWFGGSGNSDGLAIGIIQSNNYASVSVGTYGYLTTTTLVPQNQWTHYAVTRASGTITIWINGTSANTLSYPGSLNFTSQNLIGARNDLASPCYWHGYIDEIRISNVARTIPSGGPASAYTSDSNTLLLLHFNSNFTDSSPNNIQLTPTNIGMVTSPVIGSSAGYFNGSSQLIAPTSNNAFNFGTGNFTVECWIWVSASGTNSIYDGQSSSASSGGVYFAFNGSNYPYLYSGSSTLGTGSVAITLSTWNHVALVRTGSAAVVYVNGVSSLSVSLGGSLTDSQCFIGSRYNSSNVLNGYIDEFRVSNVARYSTTFIPPTTTFTPDNNTSLLLHFDGNFNDSSLNNFSMTNNGCKLTSKFGQSAYFNGYSYATIADSSIPALGSNNFVIEFWMYQLSSQTTNPYIISKTRNDSTIEGCFIQLANTGNIYVNATTNGTSYVSASYTSAISNNTWYHVAAVRSGTDLFIYVNGIKGASVGSITGSITNNTLIPWTIGTTSDFTRPFTGYIDELRISIGTDKNYNNATIPVPNAPFIDLASSNPDYYTSLLCHFDTAVQDDSHCAVPLINMGKARFGNSSAYFSGNGSYITGPSGNSAFKFSGDFTIEGWYNFKQFTNSPGIFDTRTNQALSASGLCLAVLTSGNIRIDGNGSGSIFGGASGIASGIVLNIWTHIAVIRSNGILSIYINGTSIGSSSTNQNFSDGSFILNRDWFTGYIDEFRISNIARSIPVGGPTSAYTIDGNTTLLMHFNNNFIDSASALTMTPTNIGLTTISSTQTKFGNSSAYFNGYSYATIPNSSLYFGSNNFVIECWVYKFNNTGNQNIFSNYFSSNNMGIQIGVNTSGVVYFYVSNNNSTQNFVASTGSTGISLNTWVHIAAVRSGSNLYIYMNGTRGSTTVTSMSGNLTPGTADYCIGMDQTGYFNGYIDELRISIGTDREYNQSTIYVPPISFIDTLYNTALLCHFDQKPNQDDSLKSLTITNNNVTTYMPINPKFGTYSGYFDGSTSKLIGPTNNSLFKFPNDFTIEAWVYPINYNQQGGVWANDNSGGGPNGCCLRVSASNGLLCFDYNNTSLVGSSSPLLNQWSHIAVSRTNGIINLYLNGINVGSVSNSVNYSVGNCNIGYSGYSSQYFSGYIDNLRINNTTGIYTTNFTPTQVIVVSGTTLLVDFENGTKTVSDTSGNNVSLTNTNVGGLTPVYKFGTSACYFNGVDASLTSAANNSLKFGTGNFTYEAWIYPLSFTNSTVFYNGDYGLFISPSGMLSGGGVGPATGSLSLTLNTWQHVALVRNSGTITVYLNGTASGSCSDTYSFNTGTAAIGTTFNGYIDELRVSNIARTIPAGGPNSAYTNDSNTMLLLHFDGSYTDSSNSPITLTNNNTTLITGPKFGTGCSYFNGTNAYLSIANNELPFLGNRNFVIEAWVFMGSSQVSTSPILGRYTSGGGSGFLFFISGNTLYFNANDGSWHSFTNGGTVPYNTWTHVAVSRSGNTVRLFINGTIVGTPYTTAGTLSSDTATYYIGYDQPDSTYFRGFIDELKFSIDTDRGYTQNFTPPAAPFIP